MENVMTKGFCELNENEMMMVDGGFNGQEFAFGTLGLGGTLVAGACAMAAATAIIAAGPIVVGAVVIGSCIAAGSSGWLIGDSFMHN